MNGRDGGGSRPKPSTKHPYAAVEHRIIDSPAYADLTFSAHSLMLLMVRQLTRDNNGTLQASYTWCKRFGFGSEHTLRTALAELISHGFIYKTRSHGANGAWAKYAVTWKSVTRREGLFLDNFVPCAWREWQPDGKKSTRQKLLDQSGKKCSFTPQIPAKTAGSTPAKNATYELIPCSPEKKAAAAGVEVAVAVESDLSLRGKAAAAKNSRKKSAKKPVRPAANPALPAYVAVTRYGERHIVPVETLTDAERKQFTDQP